MIIAVPTDLVTYACKYMLTSKNDTEINYISQRLAETVPQMQRTLTIWCIQDIEDHMAKNELSYLEEAPLKRLLEVLKSHMKEFAK